METQERPTPLRPTISISGDIDEIRTKHIECRVCGAAGDASPPSLDGWYPNWPNTDLAYRHAFERLHPGGACPMWHPCPDCGASGIEVTSHGSRSRRREYVHVAPSRCGRGGWTADY